MVPASGVSREAALLRDPIITAIEKVLDESDFILGLQTQRFELELARYLGVPSVVGVGSGMDALEIALTCLGLSPGSKILTTPLTAAATVMAIIRSGHVPVIGDVSVDSGLLDLETVRDEVTPPAALCYVHLYGDGSGAEGASSFAHAHAIPLIHDMAQGHGLSFAEDSVSRVPVLAAYSFYPTKNLGALGDAGCVVTWDDSHDARARRLRDYGQSGRYQHETLGLNSRLGELQAAILRVKLRFLFEATQRRRTIAESLMSHIDSPSVRLPPRPLDPELHVFHQFVVRVDDRDHFRDHCLRGGVQTDVHYPRPLHRQPAFRPWFEGVSLPRAEKFAAECVSLPCHPYLSDSEVGQIIEVVNAYSA